MVSIQLSLQFSNSKDNLRRYLETVTGKPVSIIVTDNSTSMLSIRTKGCSIFVRMHGMFLNAGEEVIREIAGFIKTRKGRTPLIRKFISENRTCLKKAEHSRRTSGIRARGRFSVHNSEFRKRERLFREYEKAISWEKRHDT